MRQEKPLSMRFYVSHVSLLVLRNTESLIPEQFYARSIPFDAVVTARRNDIIKPVERHSHCCGKD